MRHTSVLCGFMALATFATAIPISSASPKRGVANSDDIAVFEYTEAVPDTMDKREDGDDRVVFSWAAPESKEKREDGDDQVVYTWAVPDAAD